MLDKDYRDILGGALLIGGGIVLALYSMTSYDLGTVRRMGPGMFPFGLGMILAVLGVAIVLPALKRPGSKIEIRIYSPLFVLTGVAAFAFLIPKLGLLPAAAALIVITSLAELKVRPVSLLLLTLIMCALSYLVFGFALGLPIRFFRWPF